MLKKIYLVLSRGFSALILSIFLISVYSSIGFSLDIPDEAQKVYEKNSKSVFQVRVIDSSTAKKSSIGSGFLFSEDGHIATNFHVIAQAVQHPDRYRLEYVAEDNREGPLEILQFDVVHDLAIVRATEKFGYFIPPGSSNLSKGTKIFSMGNPHDLGMTVIDGTYNGLMEQSLYQKILFSGSLNPGMSGGPALNHDGEVIGVNVSTAGNDVSFLVPVEYLNELYNQLLKDAPLGQAFWDDRIEQQLVENQTQYMQELMEKDWNALSVGNVRVPGEMAKAFRCWGESKNEKKDLFSVSLAQCSSEDVIYISSDLYTGQIGYQYEWLKSKGLNMFRYYNLLESHYGSEEIFTNAGKEEATNFQCHTNFVTLNGADWKLALCARNYKKYPLLYDINVSMASVHSKDAGLIVRLVALGIERDTAIKFIKKFLGEVQWQE